MSKSPRQIMAEVDEVDVARRAARIRLAIIAVAILAIAGFGLAIFLAVQEEGAVERWDLFAELRREMEPAQDPIWNNPYGLYNPERERYIAALEKFLDTKAKEEDDALAPHTRALIAKTVADHILSNPGLLDMNARSELYAKGAAQLEALRDDYPDFPLNWSKLSSDGFPSLTRQFLNWFRENEKWEKQHLLAAKEPDSDVRVLFRTERGDMLIGLYGEDAGDWTEGFIDRAIKGFYDGTAFMVKEEVGDVAEPEEHYVVGGLAESRGSAEPYDVDAHKKVADAKTRSGILPSESRNRIPHDGGILAAWHEAGDEYDHAERFLLVARRSPRLDYEYTPTGKLLDEGGVDSHRVLERIFGGAVWREDEKVRGDTELTAVLSYLQVPVKIVKALVYRNGVLQEPAEGPLPAKATVDETEKRLSTLKVDRYKQEPPPRPQPKDDEGGKKNGDGRDGAGDDEPLPPIEPLPPPRDDGKKDDDGSK